MLVFIVMKAIALLSLCKYCATRGAINFEGVVKNPIYFVAGLARQFAVPYLLQNCRANTMPRLSNFFKSPSAWLSRLFTRSSVLEMIVFIFSDIMTKSHPVVDRRLRFSFCQAFSQQIWFRIGI